MPACEEGQHRPKEAPKKVRGNLSGRSGRGQNTPEEAGIRAKPQREHRNATEFARNRSGSVETQRNSRETTAGASKRRPRPTACAVAARNLNGPPTSGQKRPKQQARRGRNSCETTAGASKRRSRPTAACAVAAHHQFLYSQRKNPIVQALFGE